MITSVDIVFRTVLVNAVMLVTDLLVIVAVMGVLVVASPAETLLAAGALSLLAFTMLRMTQSQVTKVGVHVQSLGRDLLKVINQGLGAIKEVKVLNRENYFLEQYHQMRERQSKLLCFYETFQNIPKLSLEALFTILLCGIVVLVTIEGRDRSTTIPLLGLFGYVGFRLLPSLAGITAKLQRLSFGSAAVNHVYEDYVRLAKGSPPPTPAAAALPFAREIRVDDVSYSYPAADRPALNHVSITVPYGSSLGIVGPSGSGKSTLIDILMGLLTPDSGRILADGVDTSTSVRAWQRNIGYVPQSPYLLDDTLRRNIAFGLPDSEVDEAAVVETVRMAQLNDLVAGLPKGLDTETGERGIRLSVGQRQRVVIARALYRRPAVLVFDEATSALDNLTEREITAAIDALAREKTIIIVAHRMTTVRNCDRIVFLVDGKIADVGTYDELLARNPDFSRLALADNFNTDGSVGTIS
jgi:ATP-binding cassette, subfamily B, bacterial PglK